MTINSLFLLRAFLLLLSLGAFYRLWTSTHLLKKIFAWVVFQLCVILLWLSAAARYHDHLNPLPQVIALMIGLFSLGLLGIMLVFALGVSRRHHSLDLEKMNHEGAA